MKTGKYFEFSQNNEEQFDLVSFQYMGVEFSVPDEPLFYPIYVTFDSTTIDFNIHYVLRENLLNAVYHTELFSLPVSANNFKNDLTDSLKQLFNVLTDYPLGSDINKTYYPTESEYKYDYDYENRSDTKYGPSAVNKFIFPLRRIFLDFLFDLNHGSVFHDSKWYDETINELKNNFLFSAISARCEYYYNRRKYLEISNSALKRGDGKNPISEHFASELLTAEANYLNILRVKMAEDILPFTHWFNNGNNFNLESEYNDVLFWRKDRFQKEGTPGAFNSKGRRALWLTTLMQEEARPTSAELISLNQHDKKSKRKKLISLSRNENKLYIERASLASSHWYLGRSNFIKAFLAAIQLQHIAIGKWLVPVFFAIYAVVIAWILYVNEFNIGITVAFFSYPLLLALVLIFKGLTQFGKKKKQNRNPVETSYTAYLYILSPRLLVAVVSAIGAVLLSVDYWENAFDIKVRQSAMFLIFSVILVMVFLFVEIKSAAKDLRNSLTVIARAAQATTVALFYSFCFSFVIISFSSERILKRSGILKDYYKQELKAKKYDPIVAVNADIIDSYKKHDYFNIEPKNFPLRFSGKLIDTVKRELDMDMIYKNLDDLEDNQFLFDVLNSISEEKRGYSGGRIMCTEMVRFPANIHAPVKINIFYGMIILTCAIGLVTGVFVQLITEDRSITEPI